MKTAFRVKVWVSGGFVPLAKDIPRPDFSRTFRSSRSAHRYARRWTGRRGFMTYRSEILRVGRDRDWRDRLAAFVERMLGRG